MATLRRLCVALLSIASHAATTELSSTGLANANGTLNESHDASADGHQVDLRTSSHSASIHTVDRRAARTEISKESLLVPSKHMPTFLPEHPRITPNLDVRQDPSAASTTCVPHTAESVVATCTPVAGKAKGQICRARSTATITGCDVVDTTSSTTVARTITAYCDQKDGCGSNKACNAKGKLMAPLTCETCSPVETGLPVETTRKDSAVDLGDIAQVKAPEAPKSPAKIPLPLAEPDDYNDYREFMIAEMVLAEETNEVIHRVNDETGTSSSIARPFKTDEFNAGVMDLYGCTSVVALSRRGVWISHLFEVPTFCKAEPGKPGTEPDEAEWMRSAESGIFTGDDSGKFPGLNQFTAGDPDLSLFDSMKYGSTTNRASIFIITPSRPGSQVGTGNFNTGFEECKYPVEVGRLHAVLQDTYNNVQVATYDDSHGGEDSPVREEMMESTGKGRLFVQYTPRSNDKPSSSVNPGPTCEKQEAMVRLWTYGNPAGSGTDYKAYFEDKWDAMPDQIIKPPVKEPQSKMESGAEYEAMEEGLNPRAETSAAGDSCVWFGDLSTSTTRAQSTTSRGLRLTTMATMTAPLSCQMTYATAVSASDVEYCTCNDNQAHGAFTTTGDEGGVTVMCNPKGPQGTPVPAVFPYTGWSSWKAGVCRVEMQESFSESDPKAMDNFGPVAIKVSTYDAAGIMMTQDSAKDIKYPDNIPVFSNARMMFPYILNIFGRNPTGLSSLKEHGWNFQITSISNHAYNLNWNTYENANEPAGTFPRCKVDEWKEIQGTNSRDIQCSWECGEDPNQVAGNPAQVRSSARPVPTREPEPDCPGANRCM